jgi:hypothetical protein
MAAVTLMAGCGIGGSDSSKHVQTPLVRNFSPFMSPFDFNSLQQNPTFTNASLTVSTSASYPGKMVVFFQGETDIDPASIFIGGNKTLGVDPSALQITREVPNVGNVLVPVDVTLVDATPSDERDSLNAIVCQPLPPFATVGVNGFQTALPDGQYTLGLFKNIRNTAGKSLRDGPVFHSFTVGTTDALPPRVVTTSPVNGEQNVGAGVPPPPPPPGIPEDNIADVTTNIFGDTSPQIVVRFSEGVVASSINANTIQVVDAGAFAAVPPPQVPAPTFPKLKSEIDQATLPSNGHEAVWEIDRNTGGYPFDTQIRCTVVGLWNTQASLDANPETPDNPSPVQDLAGNAMTLSFSFQFQTVAPADLPANPFPENSIFWSAFDRVGALDTINQRDLGDRALQLALGNPDPFPFGVKTDVVPDRTDAVANTTNLPNFDPFEINYDNRTNGGTCHGWIYVQSRNTGQVAVLNTRDCVPVALINAPAPGGLAVQVGNGSADALLVTNESANTFTVYNIGSQTPGTQFLNGPLWITKVQPTGNTPRAISVTTWAGGIAGFNRDGGLPGPSVAMIMYADFTDGTVNTIRLADDEPVRQFALGPGSSPNDISFTPCVGVPPLMFAAISQGAEPGQGKVAYYLAGPGCATGVQTGTRPDTIVGDLDGFDGPDGLDSNLPAGTPVIFTVAESGASANSVATLGLESALNQPVQLNRFVNVGANPTRIAHRASWGTPCMAVAGSDGCGHATQRSCWYGETLGIEMDLIQQTAPDVSMVPTKDLYICARGASQVTIIDLVSGLPKFASPVAIPGVRFVASPSTQ